MVVLFLDLVCLLPRRRYEVSNDNDDPLKRDSEFGRESAKETISGYGKINLPGMHVLYI